MRLSRLFVQTLREAPSEARTPGYQYLARAGYVRPLGDGFAWLPLGARLRDRVEMAVLGALGAAGEQEVSLPVPYGAAPSSSSRPAQEQSRRSSREEDVLALAAGVIRSYRQLPCYLHESRDAKLTDDRTVSGLLGARAGRLTEVYGLHADSAGLESAYDDSHRALLELSASWELGALDVISAEHGNASPTGHLLALPWAGGDEHFAICPHCGYAADEAVARVCQQLPEPEALRPMQDVETPDCKTIAELARFLGVPESRTAKAVFLVANSAAEGDRFVFAVVRGDTALSESRLKAVLGAEQVGPATEAEIRLAGAEPGYGSPVGLSGVTVVVDNLAARTPNLVAGANRPGYHALNVNLGRDYTATILADIAAAQAGSPCPSCGSPLAMEQGVALAELGRAPVGLSLATNATYLDAPGRSQPLLLSTLRLYIDRLVAAVAERHTDTHGLVWPSALAPYHVYLMTLGKASPELSQAAERVYDALNSAGIAVLFDDREERAGVKFNDADLLGLPWRVALGDRGLQSDTVELKSRSGAEVETIGIDGLAARLTVALAGG